MEINIKDFDKVEPSKQYSGDMFKGGTVQDCINYLNAVKAHFGNIKIDVMFKGA